MKLGKKRLDLPQAIVIAVVLGSLIIAAGLVLTFGPADARTHVAEWIAAAASAVGILFAAFRSGILSDEDGGPSVALLFVAAACAAGAMGCGGVPREARLGVEQLAVGVDRADVLVAARVETQGEDARRQVLEEVVAGTLANVEAGLVRYDVLLEGERAAVNALEAARAALLTLEAALDAWDTGASDSGFLGAAACAAVALLELVGALEAGGVDIPPELAAGVDFLEGFARGACESARPEPRITDHKSIPLSDFYSTSAAHEIGRVLS